MSLFLLFCKQPKFILQKLLVFLFLSLSDNAVTSPW